MESKDNRPVLRDQWRKGVRGGEEDERRRGENKDGEGYGRREEYTERGGAESKRWGINKNVIRFAARFFTHSNEGDLDYKKYTELDDSFYVILSSTHGATIVRMLVDHKVLLRSS